MATRFTGAAFAVGFATNVPPIRFLWVIATAAIVNLFLLKEEREHPIYRFLL